MEPMTLIIILAVAFIPVVIGMLWYGPVFGKRWMAYEGVTPEMMESTKKGSMLPKILAGYLGNVLLAYVLAWVVNYMVVAAVIPALQLGFLVWLGFMFPVALTRVLWDPQKKPLGYLVLNSGYFLVSVLIMSVILTLWT